MFNTRKSDSFEDMQHTTKVKGEGDIEDANFKVKYVSLSVINPSMERCTLVRELGISTTYSNSEADNKDMP
jgi:hypothetical protein